MKYKTGLVAVGVLAAATALMVFFVLPNIDEGEAPEATQQAGQPANGTTPAQTPAADAKQPRTETAADGKAASETANADAAAAWQAPSFDLLRVEPDGSTVIAGHAEPNKKLQILSGETVVATTDVGPSGDFAAVFDKPLAAGNHELTLRIQDDGSVAKTSEEVATISIPKDGSGELLAMVTKPGSASRLITVLQGPEGTANSGVALSQGTTDTATLTQPDAGAADQAAGGTVSGATQTDLPNVRISAVELEGDKMFVAGTTKPDALVRIYANDKLLGEIKSDPQGRYVVDGQMSLPVGRHTIRADVMSVDGAKVELRASVPFDRPEGEQVAVVAQDNGAADQAGNTLGLIDDGAFDKLRAEANKAVALLSGLYANGRLPSTEELAAARSATEIALQSLAAYKAPPGGPGEAIAARTSAVAADALAKLKALPADAATLGESIAAIETSVKDALTPATKGSAAAKDVAQAPSVDIGRLEAEVAELNSKFRDLFAEGRTTQSTDIQMARDALESALGKVSGYSAPTGTDAARLALIDKLKVWAKSAQEGLTKLPADAPKESYSDVLATLKAAPKAMPSTPSAGATVAVSEIPAAGATQPAADAGATNAGTQSGAVGTETQASAEKPETVEQAPLKESKTSVIIRRGDTLWQIARRVYGQGVRYTSIYLANEDQITNPDRILPGQIFGVPDEAMPETEAEQMHRKRLKHD
ncbi:LysM peptidoglycan-binding domain-containing protein [Rhizobium sp. ARZ01]|uniref:LysM peptidoglycan-binding domain-containing protein n=1 Tax=Rhizobium sp. ARZ01 TaxID=2769313 RepID=UPI001786111B|nr:LysM peptidoglycan-binding domain-containing protein [Rhizobium sp. ARZ01]MBD9371672.1 LysM peptidoglycan-binding domain-containing protein [Rhizobium sp. ARZ01]